MFCFEASINGQMICKKDDNFKTQGDPTGNSSGAANLP
jgi:hypothetical protein